MSGACVVAGKHRAVPPLAGGQPAPQLQVRVLQEDVLVLGVSGRHAVRMVWSHGQ